jgi:hypothetical protein
MEWLGREEGRFKRAARSWREERKTRGLAIRGVKRKEDRIDVVGCS